MDCKTYINSDFIASLDIQPYSRFMHILYEMLNVLIVKANKWSSNKIIHCDFLQNS